MYYFRFRLIPFIATLVLVALGLLLANWQTRRAVQKEVIEARIQQCEHLPAVPLPQQVNLEQMEYRRVSLVGQFVTNWPVYLDNRPLKGAVGLYVLMPFRVQSGSQQTAQTIMVMRGWLPRNALNRAEIKNYRTAAGMMRIEGILRASSGHIMELGASAPITPGSLQQNLDLVAFGHASGLSMAPFVIEQTEPQLIQQPIQQPTQQPIQQPNQQPTQQSQGASALSGQSAADSPVNDGLVRDWPRASMGSERHRGYAFQWLALALMAFLFFIVTGVKSGKKSKSTT